MNFLLPLSGGMLIGLASVLLMALNGRIAGISGIASGIFRDFSKDQTPWRLAFVAGLVIGPLLMGALLHRDFIGAPTVGPAVLVIAGLAVGVGTALSNGCTSGHGICGLARFSTRSLAATLTFMFTAALVVFITRHLI